jgi:peptide/nickel transport system substrate-binding protein
MIRRRHLLGASAAAATAGALPRFAIAQSDNRPTVTVALQKVANSNTLDGLREQSNVGTRTMPMFTERLVDLNYQGGLEPVPGLATGWKRIDDRTVEFSLRQGVKFHNGDEMTSEDVVYSFSPEHMFGTTRPAQSKTLELNNIVNTVRAKTLPAEVPPVARRLWPALDRVEAVDKYTVRFINATPDVTLVGRASQHGSEVINRRATEAAPSWLDYSRAPVGTGPFKVREYRPDDMLILDAHDEYWGGRPPIRTLRLVEVPEVASRVNGLLTGEYQFACDIPPDQIPRIEQNGKFEVQGGTIPNIRITALDMHHPVLRDPRVRLAMAHAIDRQAIIDSLWSGRTRIPAGLQFEFYGDMFVKGWTVPQYDPAKAKELLKAAGYKGDPLPYRLLNNYYTNQVPSAQIIAEMWNQVGINVDMTMRENWTQVQDRKDRGVNDWSCSAAYNDPVSSIVSQFGTNGEDQQTGYWTNAEMDTLSTVMQSSTDMEKRHQAFARMLQICEREDPCYIVLHQNAVFTGKPKSIRWKAAPSFAMDFRNGNFAES